MSRFPFKVPLSGWLERMVVAIERFAVVKDESFELEVVVRDQKGRRVDICAQLGLVFAPAVETSGKRERYPMSISPSPDRALPEVLTAEVVADLASDVLELFEQRLAHLGPAEAATVLVHLHGRLWGRYGDYSMTSSRAAEVWSGAMVSTPVRATFSAAIEYEKASQLRSVPD